MASSGMRREEGRPVSKSFECQASWVCIPQAGRREAEAEKLEAVSSFTEVGGRGGFTSGLRLERKPGKYPLLSFVNTKNYTLEIRLSWKLTIFKE